MSSVLSEPAAGAARPGSAGDTPSGRGSRPWIRRRRRIQLHVLEGICECRSCGFFQRLPVLPRGQVADCRRCHAQIGRRRTNPPVSTPLAFCVASALLYLVAITQPLMTIDIYGRSRSVTLLTGPIEMIREGLGVVGILVALATVIIPPIVIGLMMTVLIMALRRRLPRWVPRLMRYYEQLRPWSMVEVYMLGIFVAYTKLIDLAHVDVGPAVYALAALMLTMAAVDSTFDIDLVWERRPVSRFIRKADGERVIVTKVDATEMELPPAAHLVACTSCGLVCTAHRELPQERVLGNCPRCRAPVSRRKPQSVLRCMLLVGSAIILYVPANVFSVMTIIKLGQGGGHTILEGVRELYEAHMLPLALLVFFASITVPVIKIAGLLFMSWCTWRGSSMMLLDRGRLFRIIDFIGRWSMIDVFMVSILVALVQFESLARISANPGVMAFASVVVLTIFAADCFDPRLMWDAAGLNGVVMQRHCTRSANKAASSQKTETAPA